MDKETEISDSSNTQYNNNLDMNVTKAKLGSESEYNGKSNENGDSLQLKDEPAENITTAEDQLKKYPYPKSIPFIISNEFCERFNYYGIRTILVIYLTQQLGYSDDDSTIIYHVFTMLVYFLCIFGAVLSDSWLGKFKTIFYLSMVYVCGSVLLAIGAIPTLNLDPIVFTMIGLSLIALGSGGIKPCVSAFGGDQFKIPEQLKQMTTFFSIFYFAINSGSVISTTITPILRQDVHCFGQKECYSLAFGVPAVLMCVSIVIFVLGKPLYKTKPPSGNMVVLVTKTIGNAIVTKFREKKTHPRQHWLDYSENKYGKQMVDDVKVLMRILLLYLPLPVFWALFDQQGSRWTLQATRMNGDFGSFDIKPDQLQLLNPLMILIFIPLYEVAFYPLLNLVGIRRPLQKLTLGGIFAGIAFIISGVVELNLESTYPVLPSANNAQLRIFNAEPCGYVFKSAVHPSFTVAEFGYYEDKNIKINGNQLEFDYTITSLIPGCNNWTSGAKTMNEFTAYGLFLGSVATKSPYWYDDSVKKPSRDALARTLANLPQNSKITWKKGTSIEFEATLDEVMSELTTFYPGTYNILVNDVKAGDVSIMSGGVYTVMVNQSPDNSYDVKVFTVTESNTINILWLIPQYVVMTLGEVMFSVTGIEFSYSQAPLSMKSVLQACWQLTVAFGNVIVIIIAEAKFFESQASEFFLFAGLMFVDMLIFMVLAWRYKSNDPNQIEIFQTADSVSDKNAILENPDNKKLSL